MQTYCVLLLIALLALTCLPINLSAQKQLIILKKEKVVYRFYGGDEIVFSLKEDKKDVIKSYVNNVLDTAFEAHDVIIPYHKIARIYINKRTFWRDTGPKLIVAGLGYFLIDLFNTTVIQDEEASLDKSVTITSSVLVGAGAAMMLIQKKYQTIGGRHKLMMVEKGSAFYRPDLRVNISGE
jgi:hypothetical protein